MEQEDTKQYVVRTENERGMDMVSMMLVVQGKNINHELAEKLSNSDRFENFVLFQIHCP